jgi:hypothetical protein
MAQLLQKRAVSVFSESHFGHLIATVSPLSGSAKEYQGIGEVSNQKLLFP